MPYPSFYLYVSSDGKVHFQDQTFYKINQTLASFARKWTHFCFSSEFPSNEVQVAINGNVFEKRTNPSTSPAYENQFGGGKILKETKDSVFIFTLGRYHFDNSRAVYKAAGVNAWNKTLTEDELTSFSSCEQNQDTLRNGNILSRKHKWTFPSGSLIKETDFDLADFFCIEHKKNRGGEVVKW